MGNALLGGMWWWASEKEQKISNMYTNMQLLGQPATKEFFKQRCTQIDMHTNTYVHSYMSEHVPTYSFNLLHDSSHSIS